MKRVNCYAVIREMREQVVKTMQERGIKELPMFKSYQEWGKEQDYKPDDYEEDETDDTDYQDYKDCEAPYAIFFGKYGTAYDYRVDKVRLKTYKDSAPVLEFDCHESELGDDTFGEDDLVLLTLYNVYDTMLDLLEVKDEPEYVWVFTADQVADDDVFDVITEVFATEEAAKEHLHEFVYGDEGELEYAEKRGWTVEYNEPDHYRAFEEGYYSGNHTELTIEKKEVKR